MSDNINYYKKYLKYKIKYLELKQLTRSDNLEGGKLSKVILKLKLGLKKKTKKIKRLSESQIKLHNYLSSLISDVDILINLKYEKDYYEFIKLLIIYLNNLPKIKLNQDLINLITIILITQSSLILDLYNNKDFSHLIIPLIKNLLNSKEYQNEIKIFLKHSENEDIIKILKKSNEKVIVDYLKNLK